MATPRAHLRRAPIVEAVIDFRVLPPEDLNFDRFAGLTVQIGEQYRQSSRIQSLTAQFGVQVPPTQVETPIGWQYRSASAVAQFRVNGFTFSKLEPYTTWEDVFAEAWRLWGFYVQIARPLETSRVAVRYINRLRLLPPAHVSEYLEAPPMLPPPMPQSLREFITRVVVDAPDRNLSAILIQALEASLDSASIQVLLDIDAFRELTTGLDDPSLRETFQQLRIFKNEIFFASITERAAEMYE
jgi:uncharacterized protein (TIGR04255 family)